MKIDNLRFVLTHGAWGNRSMMLPLAKRLVNSLRVDPTHVIIPRLVGHDGQEFTEAMAGFGLDDYSRHIMQQSGEGKNPVVFIGHSLTALCAKQNAQNRPSAIGSIMIDPPGLGGLSWSTTWRILKNPNYVSALWSERPFLIEELDAIEMLFNGEVHPQVESIVRQPASGLAVKQAIRAKVTFKSG